MSRYKYKRSSLQFPIEFIEYLNYIVGDEAKNHYIMRMLDFDFSKIKYEKKEN